MNLDKLKEELSDLQIKKAKLDVVITNLKDNYSKYEYEMLKEQSKIMGAYIKILGKRIDYVLLIRPSI